MDPEAPEDPEVTAMQAMYLEMEKEFIDKMGLKPEDLPAGYKLASAGQRGGHEQDL